NEFQGWEPKKFKPEFEKCLDYAIEHCAQGKEGVFVVSIPDYGYTPYGSKNQAKISARLDIYNLICKTITTEKGVDFYDITPISRQDKKDKTLLAKDGLHPSAKQYTLWVNSFADKVYKLTK
ncbi:MAG: lysophospholipase L1-like esterase, partial [Arenicella sp.]